MMSTKGFGKWLLQPTSTHYLHSFTCSFISNSDPHILNKIEILQPESLLAFTCNPLLGQQVFQPGYEPPKHRSRILPYYTNLLIRHMVCYIKSTDGFLSQYLPTLTILLYETMAEYCHGYLSSAIQSRVTTLMQFIS